MMGEICELPLGHRWLGSDPLDGPVHRGSPDAEEFRELGLGVVSRIVQLKQMLGLSASASAACHGACPSPSQPSSLTSPSSDQVGFELRDTSPER
jgi:hypothetical protein